jgi:hypothetical protein
MMWAMLYMSTYINLNNTLLVNIMELLYEDVFLGMSVISSSTMKATRDFNY